jgi:hypothetical protein
MQLQLANGLADVYSGLRLMEYLRPRRQDIDFRRNEIMLRDRKGAQKDAA